MITKCVLTFTKDKSSGWFLDITVKEPGMSPKNYNSFLGESVMTGADFGNHVYFSTAADSLFPASEPLRTARQTKISRLLLPSNWAKVKAGCLANSKKTSDWLESYLGISATAMNDADLEIPT